MTPLDQYRLLVNALRLAAAPQEEQVSALPEFVCATDEIAMTFGDAYLLLPQLEQAGLVPSEASIAIRRLESLFEAMPEDGSLAAPESLSTHPFWARARKLAAQALDQLEEQNGPLDLSDIAWVKG